MRRSLAGQSYRLDTVTGKPPSFATFSAIVITPQRAMAIVALLLLFAAPLSAQTTGEKTADWISTGLVGVNLTADVIHDVRHHCVKNLLIRNGLTIGIAELTKLVVHEDRPDHSDRKSFYSEHSALAMANYGWSYRIGFSVALGAGVGRVVASKHHPTDVLVGLAAGLGAQYFFPCGGMQ